MHAILHAEYKTGRMVPSRTMIVKDVQSDLFASGFRLAMSRLKAAVQIITTDGIAGRFGATAIAVCSVSDSPPQLLICLNNRGRTLEAVLQNGFFCANVLSADDASIADVFAGRLHDQIANRFQVGEWTTSKCGSPLLLTSLASL